MVTEFWSGWFDYWGEEHRISNDGSPSIQRSVQTLEEILFARASVNFYMFHGGTNFGFMNGANLEPAGYRAEVTSYDYTAPLDECGDPSPRFTAYRDVLRRYVELPDYPTPQPSPKRAYGSVFMTESVPLFESLDVLSRKQTSLTPAPMEYFDQDYGLILYRTHCSGPRLDAALCLHEVHDRAQVFVNGHLVSILKRETGNETILIAVPPQGGTLDLLVENMGRVNFGPPLMDRKGILGGVSLDGQFLFNWDVYPLPLKDLSGLKFMKNPSKARPNLEYPSFFRGELEVDVPADTFLSLPGWIKGVVWINGFNLGRYWNRGPQKTLYIPGPLLRPGRNELVILELHGAENRVVELCDRPVLG